MPGTALDLCFNKRTGGCKLAETLIDYEQLAGFGFRRKTGPIKEFAVE